MNEIPADTGQPSGVGNPIPVYMYPQPTFFNSADAAQWYGYYSDSSLPVISQEYVPFMQHSPRYPCYPTPYGLPVLCDYNNVPMLGQTPYAFQNFSSNASSLDETNFTGNNIREKRKKKKKNQDSRQTVATQIQPFVSETPKGIDQECQTDFPEEESLLSLKEVSPPLKSVQNTKCVGSSDEAVGIDTDSGYSSPKYRAKYRQATTQSNMSTSNCNPSVVTPFSPPRFMPHNRERRRVLSAGDHSNNVGLSVNIDNEFEFPALPQKSQDSKIESNEKYGSPNIVANQTATSWNKLKSSGPVYPMSYAVKPTSQNWSAGFITNPEMCAYPQVAAHGYGEGSFQNHVVDFTMPSSSVGNLPMALSSTAPGVAHFMLNQTFTPKQEFVKRTPEDLLLSNFITQQKIRQRAPVSYNTPMHYSDGPGVVPKRGKERETPKVKKQSSLKKIILKEREEKRKNRLECLEANKLPPNNLRGESFSNMRTIDKNMELMGPVVSDSCLEAAYNSGSEASYSAHGVHQLVDSTDEDDNHSDVSNAAYQSDASIVSQKSFAEMSSLSASSPASSDVSDNHLIIAPIVRDYVLPKIHTRQFREYCNQVLSSEIDACCCELLQKLLLFQEKSHRMDPIKAKQKRRLVMGLREVRKHMKVNRIKCLVISPNLEKIQSKGGLDEALDQVILLARDRNIPFVFALGRKALGKAVNKVVPISCVGIFSYQGAEGLFNKLMELTETARTKYKDLVLQYQSEFENDIRTRQEHFGVATHLPPPIKKKGHMRTPSGASLISFSSLASEPISEDPENDPEFLANQKAALANCSNNGIVTQEVKLKIRVADIQGSFNKKISLSPPISKTNRVESWVQETADAVETCNLTDDNLDSKSPKPSRAEHKIEDKTFTETLSLVSNSPSNPAVLP